MYTYKNNHLKKLLWPEVCPFCLKPSSQGICLSCREKLEKLTIRQPKCMQCGKPVRYKEQEYCHDCAHTHHYYDRGVGLWLHKEPVNTSIYQFKYHNQRVFGSYYAKEILKQHEKLIRSWNPNLIIPIPLHKKRRRKRGYNQAEILARELGNLLAIPVDTDVLQRIRYTDPQKMLDHKKRRRNLQRAFAVKKSMENVRSVVLIDDIYTTGSTIDAAAKALKERGVLKVYFLTISIGQGY